MEVDNKSGTGAQGGGANQKKRGISFRLSIPSKRQKLPYQQRSSASRYSSFYVEEEENVSPGSPTTQLAMEDEDLYFDNDAESMLPHFPSDPDSNYPSQLEHDSFASLPIFTSPVQIGEGQVLNEATPRYSSHRASSHLPTQQSVQERLQKSYERVESEKLFKDCPFWSALLEAKKNGPSGTFFLF